MDKEKKSPLIPSGMDFNDVVKKCARFMHDHLQGPKGFWDYDIVSQHIDDDEWEIYLRPNYLAEDRIVAFHRKIENNHIQVSVFLQTRQFDVQF